MDVQLQWDEKECEHVMIGGSIKGGPLALPDAVRPLMTRIFHSVTAMAHIIGQMISISQSGLTAGLIHPEHHQRASPAVHVLGERMDSPKRRL
jgi:hypothetical protein